MSDFSGTDKQRTICRLILEHAEAHGGAPMDFHALHAALPWDATPQALQCSIRFLEKHEMLTRTYGARRRLYLAGTKRMKDFYGT